VNYAEWEATVPSRFKEDSLWTVTAYRMGLFVGELGWSDATKLLQDRRTVSIADQLFRAVGKISPDIAEGYSRTGGNDRARFFEYALGSAREARDWYYKGRHVLGDAVFEHRSEYLTEITKLLITMTAQQRAGKKKRLN
jgi:four helix bundle protein